MYYKLTLFFFLKAILDIFLCAYGISEHHFAITFCALIGIFSDLILLFKLLMDD